MPNVKATQLQQPSPPPKPIRGGKPCNTSLDERVKGLIQYAETPEEIDVLVHAYKEILKINKKCFI